MKTSIFISLTIFSCSFIISSFAYDIDGDGKEGVPEAIHALQVVSGMAPASSNIIFIEPGGDALANGAALIARIDGITDASDTNPYLLKLEPGIYNLGDNGLVMKSYVDIEGSGEFTTKITSSHSGDVYNSYTVKGAELSELRFLTIEHTGGTNSVGIYNYSSPSNMLNVAVNITSQSGVNEAIGILNRSVSVIGAAAPYRMTNIKIDTRNATASTSYGIKNIEFSSGLVTNAQIFSWGTDSYGIYNDQSTFTFNSVDIGTKGMSCYGMYNDDGAITIFNIEIDSSCSLANYGIYNSFTNVNMHNVDIDISITGAGVWNNSSPNVTMDNVSIKSSGHFGITNVFSSGVRIRNTAITVSSANQESIYGVFNQYSDAILMNVETDAGGSSSSANVFGIFNQYSDSKFFNVMVTANNVNGQHIGLNNDDSNVTIQNSNIIGATYSIKNENGSTAGVANGMLDGSINGSGFNCIGSYNVSLAPLNSVCL